MKPWSTVLRTFDGLVSSGKLRRVGLSDVAASYASRGQAIAELRGLEPFTALRLEYSLGDRAIEDVSAPLGIVRGMGSMVWSAGHGGGMG